ncbi:hypothetical protein KOR42_49720 [Thalassoglobus neptunius]|uniref:Septum site-determining protein MinD n=1 Tax=Thalassoglobus neptunius TaxID=1938619 RepID=A0A5C5VNC5_9PLAN|nr:cellulose synthase operon protein YhjQ/BcsQ [Thalassoglobus neptunius]TWT40124.1 hypothetical protein KOR42_49720 [Thalassoglobus neptunius]
MKTLVISDDVGSATQLHEVLNSNRRIKECVTRPWRTLHDVPSDQGDQYQIVFAIIDQESESAGQQILNVRKKYDSFLVVVGHADSSEDVIRLLHQGADDFVDLRRDMSSQVAELISSAKTRIGIDSTPQNVIGVIGVTGGCGTTTVAVNLAVSIAQSQESCALLDFVCQQGDVGRFLGISSNHSLQELCVNSTFVDATMLERSMTTSCAGLEVLPSTGLYGDRSQPDESDLKHLVSVALEKHDDVVIDIGSCRELHQYSNILQQTTTILLTVRPDFASVCRARNTLDYLKTLGFNDESIEVVCCRMGMSGQLEQKQAEKILGRSISFTLPDEVSEPIRNPLHAVSRYLNGAWLGEGAKRRSMRPMEAT